MVLYIAAGITWLYGQQSINIEYNFLNACASQFQYISFGFK